MNVERASRTALVIALGAVVVAEGERKRAAPAASLVAPDDAALARRLLASSGRAGRAFLAAARIRAFRAVCHALALLVAPGILWHYRARKRLIEAAARDAVAGGATRVVVLGAGFDGLAARLARETGVEAVEVDAAGTQRLKLAALGDGARGVHYVAADLAGADLSAILPAAKATVFVAEGLLMYLPSPAVRALLRSLATAAAPGSTLIATFMREDDRGRRQFRGAGRLLDWWLARVAEPFASGVRRDALGALLASAGWSLRRVHDHAAFARTLREAGVRARTAEGELVAVASVDRA